jgi:hypothetical protein
MTPQKIKAKKMMSPNFKKPKSKDNTEKEN